jgi:hypothetical protein
MKFTGVAVLITIAFFIGMMAASEIGRRIGIARLAREPDGLAKGAGAAEGAVFALLGLLLAFTFSGAASRFEARRMMINEETNAIGTAYLRIDLLPKESQPALRDMFRKYLDLRASVYRSAGDETAFRSRLAQSALLQDDIWKHAMAALKLPEATSPAHMLLVPALNEMFDITSTRQMATTNHPPVVIFVLLGVLGLVAALLVGYGTSTNKRRHWLHQVMFSLITSFAFYVIIDLEFPRLGLIRIDAADQSLIDLRSSMR